MSYKKDFDIMARLALGREVAEHVKPFKILAQMGYDEAETYAVLDFFEWVNDNIDKDVMEVTKMFVLMHGRAKFLCNTKEITRLCLILGDTRTRRSWPKKSKKK